MSQEEPILIKAVLMDFGGVMAEEGFREGLKAIGRANGLEPESFFRKAADIVYESGYVTGAATESSYWSSLRDQTGIVGSDEDLRKEILSRFTLRPFMVDLVRRLRKQGVFVALLSDQTDWLDELDRRDNFFKEFDRVFNSYRLGKGKTDSSLFSDVARTLGLPPGEILFIDDNEGNVKRSREMGLEGIVFQGEEPLVERLERLGMSLTRS